MKPTKYALNTNQIRRVGPALPGLALSLLLCAAATGEPPLQPLAVPEYSFDLQSPSVVSGIVSASDVLKLDFPHPIAELDGMSLGLLFPLDDLDGLSAANASAAEGDVFFLLFSVDAGTEGVAQPNSALVSSGIPYNATDQAARGHAAGDQFCSTESFTISGPADSMEDAVRRNNSCRVTTSMRAALISPPTPKRTPTPNSRRTSRKIASMRWAGSRAESPTIPSSTCISR